MHGASPGVELVGDTSTAGLRCPGLHCPGLRYPGLRCLVLGGSGFLGSALTAALRRAGASVRGYARRVPSGRPGVAWVSAAFEDADALGAALAGQQVVFHLVGASLPAASNDDPARDLAANVLPTLRLLDLCRAAGVRKVVFASSGGTVYGVPRQVPTPESAPTEPITAYGMHKLTIEHYLGLYRRLHGLDYQVLRIANPYGRGQSPFRRQGVVAATLHRALSGQPVELWGAGEVTRDFIHVDDVARAFVAAACYAGEHRVMNVGSGQGRSLDQLFLDVARTLGRPQIEVVRRPGRRADVPVSVLDTTLIRRETGWRPRVAFADGLAGTADWIRTVLVDGTLVG